jgi:hypothetical protein
MLGRKRVIRSSEDHISAWHGLSRGKTGLKSGCDAYIISGQTKFTSTGVDMGNPGQSGGEIKKGEVYYEAS